MQVDPMAEKFVAMNVYTGMANNPLSIIDPTGMEPECPDQPCEDEIPVDVQEDINKSGGDVEETLVAGITEELPKIAQALVNDVQNAPAVVGNAVTIVAKSAIDGTNKVSEVAAEGALLQALSYLF